MVANRAGLRRAAATFTLVAAVVLAACGTNEQSESSPSSEFAAEAGHIHGLGVNPKDDSLFIATHSGLFRSPTGSTVAERVGSSSQDTMGFTVAGPDTFFGSGHPAPGTSGPPDLGLIESRDAGVSWQEVSLLGKADFHVLRFRDDQIYGYHGLTSRLMVSRDRGVSWQSSKVPAPLFDLAVDPKEPDHIVASTEVGLIEKTANKDWVRRGNQIGFLSWPDDGPLFIIEGNGDVAVSKGSGQTWISRGRLPEAPVAMTADSPNELYVALRSGTIMRSDDGGRTWTTRVRP